MALRHEKRIKLFPSWPPSRGSILDLLPTSLLLDTLFSFCEMCDLRVIRAVCKAYPSLVSSHLCYRNRYARTFFDLLLLPFPSDDLLKKKNKRKQWSMVLRLGNVFRMG